MYSLTNDRPLKAPCFLFNYCHQSGVLTHEISSTAPYSSRWTWGQLLGWGRAGLAWPSGSPWGCQPNSSQEGYCPRATSWWALGRRCLTPPGLGGWLWPATQASLLEVAITFTFLQHEKYFTSSSNFKFNSLEIVQFYSFFFVNNRPRLAKKLGGCQSQPLTSHLANPPWHLWWPEICSQGSVTFSDRRGSSLRVKAMSSLPLYP